MAELSQNQNAKIGSSQSLDQKTDKSVFTESFVEQEEQKVAAADIRELEFTFNFGVAKKFLEHLNFMKKLKLTDRDRFEKYMLKLGVTVCQDIIDTKLLTDDDGLLEPSCERIEKKEGNIKIYGDEKIHFNQEHDFKEYEIYNTLEGEGLTLEKAPQYLQKRVKGHFLASRTLTNLKCGFKVGQKLSEAAL